MTSILPALIGVAWGALLAAPFVRRGRRASASERARTLGSVRRTSEGMSRAVVAGARRSMLAITAWPGVGSLVPVLRGVLDARTARHDRRGVEGELPVTVDLLAVAVGAGCTPFVAVEMTARWAPALLAGHLEQVRRDCALGASFADALDAAATRLEPLRPLVEALLASERYGAPVGTALARLAVEQRAAVRRRAEARARTVPVRLLFPLVFLVLPAFGLLTVVPALLTGFAA